MQPRVTKGSYCRAKCNNENRYKALQFETFKVSQTKTADQSLLSVLAKTDVDLGLVDEHWFGKSRREEKEDECCEELQKKVLATPHLSISKDCPSPSLFSPEDSPSVPRRSRRWKGGGPLGNSQATPVGFPLLIQDTSPATPGIAAFTPNQATGRALAPSQPQQSQASTSGFSPFPSWNPTNKLATPGFMKQLFKTPSSIVRTPGLKVVTPDGNQSTPQRLSVSLGADLDDSNLSWTSSLATPPGSKSNNKIGASEGIQFDADMRSGVMPKALHFTEDETKPKHLKVSVDKGCDSLENDTQPLQLLRLSSLEEETTSEDTLDSDAIGGGDEDGDVVMGIPSRHCILPLVKTNRQGSERVRSKKDTPEEKHLLRKRQSDTVDEGMKSNLNQVLGNERSIKHAREQNWTSTRKYSGKQDKEESDSKVCADDVFMPKPVSNSEKSAATCVRDKVNIPGGIAVDDYDAVSRGCPQNKESVTSSQTLRSEMTSDSQEDTSKIIHSDGPESKHESTNSDEDTVTETTTSNRTMKPDDNLSNIEETLAFFLATPPQRRAKLGKLSKSNAVNREHATRNNQDTSDEIDSKAEIKDRPSEDEIVSRVIEPSSSAGLVSDVTLQDVTKLDRCRSPQGTNAIMPLKTEPQCADVVDGGLEPQHSTIQETVTKTSSKQKQYLPNKTSTKEPEISLTLESTVSKMIRTNSKPSLEEVHLQLTPGKSNPPSTNKGSDSNHNFIVNATPNVSTDNQEFFSQISPNYADALCRAVDAVSSDQKKVVKQKVDKLDEINIAKTLPVIDIKSEVASLSEQVQCSSQVGGSGTPEGRRESSQASVQSNENQAQQANQPNQETVSKVATLFSSADQSISKTKSPSVDKASRLDADIPDEATAIFRMQPRATKMFYYPSSANSDLKPTPASKKELSSSGTPKLLAGTLYVVKEEDGAVSESDTEGQTTETSRASSTPATRSSGFVTFSSFVKSIEKKSDDKTSKSQNLQTPSPLCQPVTSSNAALVSNKSLTSKRTECLPSTLPAQTHTSNQTTPVTGRSTAPLSLRSRRRLGRSNLPPPKRLKTIVETQDFHHNVGVEGSHDSIECSKLDKIKPCEVSDRQLQSIRELVGEPHAANTTVRPDSIKIPPSKYIPQVTPQPGGFTSGFKTAANKNIGIAKTSLQKARGMFAEIYSQEIQFESVDNSKISKLVDGIPSAKTLDGKYQKTRQEGIYEQQPVSFTFENDEAKHVQTAGFSSASGKTIKISATAMERAHKIMGEVVNECENLTVLDGIDAERKTTSDSKRMELSTVKSTEHVPTNVGFSSASGKALSISAKAMQKAQTLINAVGKDLMTSNGNEKIPSSVGFSSASGKSIQISSNALKHAQSLIKSIDNECDLPQQCTDSASMPSPQSVANKKKLLKEDMCRNDIVGSSIDKAPFTGFQSASGKSIHISAEALRKAKIFVDDAQENVLETMQPISQSSNGIEKSVERSVSPTKETIPSIVQFSSASGKAIQISDASLQKAKCIMESIKETTDGSIPPSVQFSSASGKSIKISDGALDKARSFLSSVDSGISTDDSVLPIQLNSSDDTSNISNHSSVKGDNNSTCQSAVTQVNYQQTPHAQQNVKPKKDYSKLPKGFRPFKPPARATATKSIPTVKQTSQPRISQSKTTAITRNGTQLDRYNKDENQDHKDKTTAPILDQKTQNTSKDNVAANSKLAGVKEIKVEPMQNFAKLHAPFEAEDGFSDDGLSLSQAQHEIQAAEQMELVYAFMQAEDESYTQDPDRAPGTSSAGDSNNKVQINKMDLQKNRVVNAKSDVKLEPVKVHVKVIHPGDVEGIFDDSVIKEEDLRLIARAEANHRDIPFQSTNADLMDTSVVDSQESQHNTSLNQGFMNSQNTVCSELGEANAINKEEETVHCATGDKDPLNVSESAKHVLAELQEMEQQLQLTSHGKEECTGFQTASGIRVLVPRESLDRAKQVLSETDHMYGCSKSQEYEKMDLCNMPSVVKGDLPAFVGFQTGSGKRVTVSDQALQKAKHILADVEEEEFDRGISGTSGFQTAGGKRVNISAESLKKARSQINESSMPDLNNQFNSGSKHAEESLPSSSKLQLGFCTASGNKVHVSDASLQIARNFLNEEVDKDEVKTVQKQKTESNDQSVPSFTGFQTAAGSRVQVSEESLQKARDVLAEESNSSTHSQNKSVENLTIPKGQNSFIGFHTASGSKVSVSDDALQRARQFLTDDNDGNQLKSSGTRLTKCQGKVSSSTGNKCSFAGFQTASGNGVHVSEEALKRARHFLTEEDSSSAASAGDRPDSHVDQISLSITKGFVGFQTANGNKVSVSKESLEKAHNLLSEVDATGYSVMAKQDKQHADQYHPSNSTNKFVGFQTASGSAVSISNESLQKAKEFLSKDDNSEATEILQSSKPTLHGFQTASGNQVEISEDALKKAQDFLNQESCFQDNGNKQPTMNPPQTRSFVGFTTASGSAVEVSEESLKVAKSLLMDEEPDNRPSFGIVPQSPLQHQTGICSKDAPTRFGVGSTRMLDTNASKKFSPGVSKADSVVPQHHISEESTGVHFGATSHSLEAVKRKATLSSTGNDSQSKKQFVPYRRQQPVASSPAGQWADRSNIVFHKSFKPYRTTPVANNNIPNHQRQTPTTSNTSSPAVSSYSNQARRTPGQVHTEQIQVVPQQPLQSSQWSPNGMPFYKKANFQQGREQHNRGSTQQKSFQKFVSNGAHLKHHSNSNNSKNLPPSSTVSCPTTDSGSVQRQPGLKEIWKQARMKQLARIEDKKKQHIKPYPGSLLTKRQQMPRIKLYDVVDGQAPQTYSQQQLFTHGVLPDTLLINAANAESFKFKGQEHFGEDAMTTQDGILLGDGGRIVLDDTGAAGKEQFYHALLDTAGVDHKLVSCEWVYNHYRWIVWKLAAMEVAYPQQFAARLLTPHWVMLQLKYRYDREIDHTQRSALKKILERDDTTSRRLVLCVSAIHKPDSESVVAEMGSSEKGENNSKTINKKLSLLTIELTDGWYCIRTAIDKPLATMVQKGKLFVGQKLCIYGADLIGSDDACSPLEVPANLMLRICANSTRPARYDAKLGLQVNPQPFPVSLLSLYGEGGMIGCLDVVVVRSYPIQYMEKHGDSGATFRNSRAEEKEARKYSREKQQRMEKLFSKIQKDFEKKQAKKEPKRKTRSRSSQRLKEEQIQNLNTGQEVYDALNEAYDPGSIEMHLTERQMTALHNYQRSLQEKEQADLQAEFKKVLEEQEESTDRNVTPLLRVRLADYHNTNNGKPNQTCMMTVWRPTEDIMAYLTEGKTLRLYYVNVSPGRFPQGSTSVQLASTKRTRYKELSAAGDKLDKVYQPRMPTPIWHLRQDSHEALYGEVDVVGLVVSVAGGSSAVRNSTSNLQTVHIADADSNLIAIKFWGGLQVHSLEDMIKTGTFICCINLQYKGRDRYNSTSYLQASDASNFSQTPKSGSMRQVLSALKACIEDPQTFIKHIEEKPDLHSAKTPVLQPLGTPALDAMRPRRISPFVPTRSSSNTLTGDKDKCLKPSPTASMNTARSAVTHESSPGDLLTEPSTIKMSGSRNQSILHGNISGESKSKRVKSKTLSDVTPTAKRFVPFSGVKSCPVSATSKRFTPATLSKPPHQGSGFELSLSSDFAKSTPNLNFGSANSVQKHFTPVIPTSNANRNQVLATPVGGYQVGSGRPIGQARSNLFGTASGSKPYTPECTNGLGSKTPITLSAPARVQTSVLNSSFISLDSTPDSSSQSSQLEEQKKDISRRTRLLGRIPSPPPLSPLPSPMLGAVRRGFRAPSRPARRSCDSGDVKETTKSSVRLKFGHLIESRHCQKLKDNQEMVKHDENGASATSVATDDTSQAEILPPLLQDVGSAHQDKGKLLSDGLTASQREVQDVMGMSLSCLQELDMEWSQQTPVKESSLVNMDQKVGSHFVDLESHTEVNESLQICEKNWNQDTESPPMDLDDSEKVVVVQQQETKTQVKTGDSLQFSNKDAASQNNKGQERIGNTTGAGDEVTSDVHVDTTESKTKLSVTNEALLTNETIDVTNSASSSTNHNELVVSITKQTPVARGRPRVVKRPASESCSSQQKSTQSKRFCTRADFAVMDFESLELAGDMPNRRVTRSSSRKSKN